MTKQDVSEIMRGYADARDTLTEGSAALYKRAPSQAPPKLPNELLPRVWYNYFEGWAAGINDNVAGILRNAKQKGGDKSGHSITTG